MNVLKLGGAMAALCVVLSGCNATTEKDFEAGQALLRKDAAFRKEVLDDCNGKTKALSSSQKIEFAVLMKVPVSEAPATFCKRLISGLAAGRITQTDMARWRRDGYFASLVQVLKTP
ncbi:hypothetical protein G6N74_15425 [Mesorhizobium sp. CGMCC 1.15528]|uniref:Lipoprotein n=1 Tax=Mesorhizobium zhangyense TaxID=1776730 RepID=A0A7C9R8J3_9HYPH|nr:hypothetical protein [Mesorhizobium zhangyense]NGN42459.1 hypothetical protein [Mesorhizobium zhangyense]